MTYSARLTITTVGLLIMLALFCIGLLQKVQAVSPPPHGGYAGGNTAEGHAALFSLTTGTYNTAIGLFSLRSATSGSFNTAAKTKTMKGN